MFRAQMDAEVAAACVGAFAADATDVVVKDAHGDGRNLSPGALPPPTRLIRGYSGHPFAMVEGLDGTFDAAMFVGYHSGAGSGGNPLSHTLSSRTLTALRLDGEPASEYRLHALAAAQVGVPVVLVTGDRALCDEVERYSPGTCTVAVSEARGAATTALHPAEAASRIRAAAEEALCKPRPDLPAVVGPHRLEVVYRQPSMAYVRSFYPGATLSGDTTVAFDALAYDDVLRALIFLVGL